MAPSDRTEPQSRKYTGKFPIGQYAPCSEKKHGKRMAVRCDCKNSGSQLLPAPGE
jgi:hypothetical protein